MAEVDVDRVRAVVFDLGGVFLEGGPDHVRSFGERHGLPAAAWDAIRAELFISGDLWNRVERAELALDAFAEELRARVAAHGVQISLDQARNFMGTPGLDDRSRIRHEIVAACRSLRACVTTALLTNNIREWRHGWRQRLPVAELFDVVIDSSEVGMRKPEPSIYRLMEERLGLPGSQVLFVDDLGVNLKTARQRGWQTVKYDDTARVLGILDAVLAAHRPK